MNDFRKIIIVLSLFFATHYSISQTTKGNSLNGDNNGDLYGFSLALSEDGKRMVVGAASSDVPESNSGHVSIYEYNSTNSMWEKLGADITISSKNDRQGWSVAMSYDGNVIAFSASQNDQNGTNSGKVFSYAWDGSNWTIRGNEIVGDDKSYFGTSIAMSKDGNRLVIGGPKANNNRGQVKVYDFNGTDWVQKGSVLTGTSPDDEFGFYVSASESGDVFAVGTPMIRKDSSNKGYVKLYKWNGTDWVGHGNVINGTVSDSHFGYCVSVSADGTIVAVGAEKGNILGDTSGSVDVYELSGNSWTRQNGTLKGINSFDKFGKALRLSKDGKLLVVGAYKASSGAGYVDIYQYKNNTWSTYGNRISGSSSDNDNMGWSVAISADNKTIGTGSYRSDYNGAMSGKVNVYELCSPMNESVTQNGAILTSDETATGVTYQWVDCNNNDAPISGETSVSFTATVNGNYAVVLTKDGCSVQSQCVTVSSLSLDDFFSNSQKVYFDFEANRVVFPENIAVVQLYDIQGNKINAFTDVSAIDTGSLSHGVYFVTMQNKAKDDQVVFKFIK